MGRYPGCTFTSPDNLAKSILSSAILDLLVENVIVQRSGSGANTDIQAGRPYLRLTQYVRRTKLAARDNSEAALLSAYRADVVPLIGRDRQMSDLRHWLDILRPISVRVLVGAGGRGKTRLRWSSRALLRKTDGLQVSPVRGAGPLSPPERH